MYLDRIYPDVSILWDLDYYRGYDYYGYDDMSEEQFIDMRRQFLRHLRNAPRYVLAAVSTRENYDYIENVLERCGFKRVVSCDRNGGGGKVHLMLRVNKNRKLDKSTASYVNQEQFVGCCAIDILDFKVSEMMFKDFEHPTDAYSERERTRWKRLCPGNLNKKVIKNLNKMVLFITRGRNRGHLKEIRKLKLFKRIPGTPIWYKV